MLWWIERTSGPEYVVIYMVSPTIVVSWIRRISQALLCFLLYFRLQEGCCAL